MNPIHLLTAGLALALASAELSAQTPARIVLIAGRPSHGPGDHEFRAGCLLLQKWLDAQPRVSAVVYSNGWPDRSDAFDDARAVFIFADGGAKHPAIQGDRVSVLDALAERGVGLGFGHYGVEVPAGQPGQALHRWIGGHYEHEYSVNPMWTPEFNSFPDHPVTRGVKPFAVLDEWYFNMRWTESKQGLTPILVASPSDDVRDGPYVYPKGPYPHIVAASGQPETMMWVYERSGRGRGFGFTGGHRHVNWGEPNFRKVVLNALLWIAKVDVPSSGVTVEVSEAELKENWDPKNR